MRWILLPGMLMLSLGLVGCATPPATSSSVSDRQELIVDPEIIYTMGVTELFEERLPQPAGDSLLQVQFTVEARSDAELAWKVIWFDARGMTVKGVGESYRKASLLAGQTRYFKATAPHARVASYQLHLREPK